MNSEFPMSFASETSPSVKSKVISISRPRDSLLTSQVSEFKSLNSRADFEYPLSELADSSDGHNQRQSSAARWVLRVILLSVLAGLWIAIGMGQLTSDSPSVAKVRALLSSEQVSPALQKTATSETSMDVAQQQVLQADSKLDDAVAQKNSERLNVNSQNTAENPADVGAVSGSVVNHMQTLEKTVVAPVPEDGANMSEKELQKTAQLLSQQQSQMLEMEEHLTSMMVRFGDSNVVEKKLVELETQHLKAAAKMKELRSKLRQ